MGVLVLEHHRSSLVYVIQSLTWGPVSEALKLTLDHASGDAYKRQYLPGKTPVDALI